MSTNGRKRPAGVQKTAEETLTNWINIFVPQTTTDLAVHHQKIENVSLWLKTASRQNQNKPHLLLITGPPGCGKTACVRVLANELGLELCEWVSPVDEEYSKENYQSQKDKFIEFLFKSSRYQSLFDTKKRVLLVEDFPNILLDQKGLLAEILELYKESGKSPLIFIATDTKSKGLDIAFNLFPDKVQAQFGIHQINFNAISTTLMKKALQILITNLKRLKDIHEGFREPSGDVLDSLIVSSQGDIRNAILNLQFVSHKFLPRVETVKVAEVSNKDVNSKRTKRTKDSNKLKEIGRDETVSIMHGLGRVFNPKYDAENNLTHSPEVLTDIFSTQPNNLILFVFQNYLAHFTTIDDALDNLQCITRSDYLLQEYRDQGLSLLALNTAIRGAMLANRAPKSGFIPVRGYKRERIREAEVQTDYTRFIEGPGVGSRNLVSRNTYVLDIKSSFEKIIHRKAGTGDGMATEDLEQAELDLIEEIEDGYSD